MSSVTAVGGAGKLRQNISTSAAVMRAAAVREGVFSRRLMVGCEHRAPPRSGTRPTASLNSGIAAQAVAIVGVFVAAGDGEHAEAQHLGHRVVDAIRIAPVPQTPGQGCGETETTLGVTQQQQAAVGRQQSAVETRRHLLAADGWKIEGKKGIVGHGGRGGFVARVEMCLNNNFLHEFNGLRHVRYPIPRAVVNNPG